MKLSLWICFLLTAGNLAFAKDSVILLAKLDTSNVYDDYVAHEVVESLDVHSILQRDSVQETLLRTQAEADQTITPAKVWRWLRSWMGHALLTAPSAAEFQPIVNVYDSRYRVVAAIAYKF